MKIEEMNRSECCGCEACANICPQNCITMERDAEGFLYPKIDQSKCSKCGRCEKVCPSLKAREIFPAKLPIVLVAVHPDQKVRRHSSSGGAFTALSEKILNDGGIIFGAGFDENWHVRHMAAENFDELENLRGSKYVQSEIGDIYKRVKSELESGRKVLFSGVPCQCAGLKNFLGKDFKNLLTVGIMCHGVPSPALWDSYINWRGRGHEITRVNFRSKRFGWTNNHFEITFKDCGYYAKPNMADFYTQLFLLSTTQRPSCSSCKFRFPNLNCDVVLGDAWGIQNFAPDFFDNRGASIIVINTQNGANYFNNIHLAAKIVNINALISNPLFFIPTPEDERRKFFFDDLAKFKLPINVMQKYFLPNPAQISAINGRKINERLAARLKEIENHYKK